MDNFEKSGIIIPFSRKTGKVKAKCPKCSGTRSNKRDKSLSVNLDEGLYKCHYCGWAGSVNQRESLRTAKVYIKPAWNNRTALSDRLVRWFESRGISQATLTRMRITEGMEYMPQKGKECNTVQFNYFRDGELINVKYRTADKLFKLHSGSELILYNIDSLKSSNYAIITEGEIDCLSFMECNQVPVVSVPNGANGTEYLDNCIEEYFEDKKTVYIAVDTDKKGILLRDELIRRFGVERCKIITYGEDCKDANEHLVKFGQKSLQDCIQNAEDISLEGVFHVSDHEQELDFLYENGLQKGYTIGHSNFDEVCSFETGRLCVVTGIPGHGKSEFVDEMAVLLNIRYNFKFAYFSPENHPVTYLLSKLISKLTGKRFGKSYLPFQEYSEAKAYLQDNFFSIYPKDDFSLEEILDKARYLVSKKGIRGLVIDPYNKLENNIPLGMSETNYISKQLDMLVNFAQRNDVLIFLVVHPRKMNKKDGLPEVPSLYDINGSANFYNKCDFGITIFRNRTNEVNEVHIQKVKFRHLGDVGLASFKYNINNGRYVPYYEQKNIDWDNSNYLERAISRKDEQQESMKQELPDDFFVTMDKGSLPF